MTPGNDRQPLHRSDENMKHDFWHEKWRSGKLGFHQEKVNSRLVRYWQLLDLNDGDPVFVPLCGKSLDMLWLVWDPSIVKQ